MSTAVAVLEIRGVAKRFMGLTALSDVTFDVPPRQVLAIIGPNGAGKTTLLNVVSGALRPTAGTVRYRGRSITGAAPHVVTRAGIARTFQTLELFPRLTVRENVMAGGVAGARERVLAALLALPASRRRRRALSADADRLLAVVGLERWADEPAAVLPAGHQRLLAVARAMATGADVLLLDEPGAGLNEAEKAHLVDVVGALPAAGKTIVFVEHDMRVVSRLAHRVVVLDHGSVIAEGTPAEVRDDPRVVEAYLGDAAAVVARGGTREASTTDGAAPVMLAIERVHVRYGGLRALRGMSLEVRRGEIVALIGANGAGKSTLLRAVSRVAPVASGDVRFEGRSLLALTPAAVVAAGITHVPEGRELFPSLTVWDNLVLGRYARLVGGRGLAAALARRGRTAESDALAKQVFALFPVLAERRRQLAGTLSGGEGQMLAIGRALMASPRLLMLDEPSLGLAPQVVRQIMAALVRLREAGMTILLVEQNARAALDIADRGYVLDTGEVVQEGVATTLAADRGVSRAYLGGGG